MHLLYNAKKNSSNWKSSSWAKNK